MPHSALPPRPRKPAAQVSSAWLAAPQCLLCGGRGLPHTVSHPGSLASTGPRGWSDSSAGPPGAPPFQPGHRRTPSEAERWLEEVAKAAKAQQQQQQAAAVAVVLAPPLPPFPLSYDAAPPPLGLFVPPTLLPLGTACPPALPYAAAVPSVPLLGLTPSQMVANAFCSASQPPAASLGAKARPFPQSLLGPAPPKPHGPPWPPEQSAPVPPTPRQEPSDPFEAQWAALEAKPPSAGPNPFAGERQKTFEIEL